MSQLSSPHCEHSRPAIQKIWKKSGSNFGRQYWVCGVVDNPCKFSQWERKKEPRPTENVQDASTSASSSVTKAEANAPHQDKISKISVAGHSLTQKISLSSVTKTEPGAPLRDTSSSISVADHSSIPMSKSELEALKPYILLSESDLMIRIRNQNGPHKNKKRAFSSHKGFLLRSSSRW